MAESENPLISVLMPVKNGEKFIAEAIDSIRSQSMDDWELIVIDDCSEDNSVQIAESFGDSRIRLVSASRPLGIAGALNRGIQLANGQFLARLDSDDLSHPKRLKTQVEYMFLFPEVGLLGTWFETLEEAPLIARHPPDSSSIYLTMLFGNPICHSSVMMRKALLRDFNLWYDETIPTCEDYDLWQRISEVSELEIIPEVLVQYRVHSNQTTEQVSGYKPSLDAQIAENHRRSLGLVFAQPQSNFAKLCWLVLNYIVWRPVFRESHRLLRKKIGLRAVKAGIAWTKKMFTHIINRFTRILRFVKSRRLQSHVDC